MKARHMIEMSRIGSGLFSFRSQETPGNVKSQRPPVGKRGGARWGVRIASLHRAEEQNGGSLARYSVS